LCPWAPALCRFWEATSGICYRTLQYAESQASRRGLRASWGISRVASLAVAVLRLAGRRAADRSASPAVGQQAGDHRGQDPDRSSWQPPHTARCCCLLPRWLRLCNRLLLLASCSSKAAPPSHTRPPPPPPCSLYEVNSNNPQPIISYDGHAGNVTSVGFQKDGKWMYSGSEDGTGAPPPRQQLPPPGQRPGAPETPAPCGTLSGVLWPPSPPTLTPPHPVAAACLPLTLSCPPPHPNTTHTHTTTLLCTCSQDLGPARPRLPARVREPRRREHRCAASQPGGAHIGWVRVWWCVCIGGGRLAVGDVAG
jgi:hypothetical protein